MRKSTKIAVLVAAIALLASMTVFAAGWVMEDGQWFYNDTYGDHVYNTWKQDNGKYYYLGDDGAMVTNQLINDGANSYYVGADGARVTNTWIMVEGDETDNDTYGVDYRWYYFANNGKAYTNAQKTINGKKYRFDSDGKMLFGFVDATYAMITETEDPILDAVYYYGPNEDGSLQTGWYQTELVGTKVTGADYYGEAKWFYFNTVNGQKVAGEAGSYAAKSIGGIKYEFDEYGIMQTGWLASPNTFSNFNSDGALEKKKWIYVVPNATQNATDNDNDQKRWFYVDYAGTAVTDQTRKINGKWYTFNDAGIMKSGLVSLDTSEGDTMGTWKFAEGGMADLTAEKLMAEKRNLAYFSGDEVADGSAKTGTIKIDLADDTYTFYFGKNFLAANGVANNKLYVNGILQTAGDMNYALVENKFGAVGEFEYYLVNSAGTIFKTSAAVRDADEVYYALYKKSATELVLGKVAPGDYAAAAANYFKTNGTFVGYTHESEIQILEPGMTIGVIAAPVE